jgi:regulatory protein
MAIKRSLRKSGGKPKVDPDRAADPSSARAAAITLLARRDFASGELAQKLAERGYEPSAVAETIQELVETRVLNDERYAANFVAYHAARGQGSVRIARDLRDLDLPDESIRDALDSGPDWPTLAREVRVRKFGLPPPESWAEKVRQARFLQYRGFSSDHIRSAIGPDFDPDEST